MTTMKPTVRLKFDGDAPEYHPATGLTFQPGEAEYGKEHEEALMATGRFKRALPPRASKDAKED